ncbi:MAG: hypothetical protein FWB91_10650 [Defluviitaleaceae bacterium]|nr:hypothetical protein [Defluviitaleaceae bacterium]
MVKKVWRIVFCIGVVCLMMVSTALAQPPTEPYDCSEAEVVTPFDIGGNKDIKD